MSMIIMTQDSYKKKNECVMIEQGMEWTGKAMYGPEFEAVLTQQSA